MYIKDERHMVFFMLSYPRCKNGFFSLYRGFFSLHVFECILV